MLIRTKTLGAFKLDESYFGSCLIKTEDPEGIDDDIIQSFELKDTLPKISNDTWTAIIKLYFKFYNIKNGQEVSVIFLLNQVTNEVHCFVPRQEVTTASVRSSYSTLCDLLTGKEYNYPDDLTNYVFYGTSHLHPFGYDEFSSTDDRYELGNLGFHILVSSPDTINNSYKVLGSLCYKKKRYLLTLNQTKQIIDFSKSDSTYHKNVLNYITEPVFTLPKKITNSLVPITYKKVVDSIDYDYFIIQNELESLMAMYNISKEQLLKILKEI